MIYKTMLALFICLYCSAYWNCAQAARRAGMSFTYSPVAGCVLEIEAGEVFELQDP